jgi:hypothetical protein
MPKKARKPIRNPDITNESPEYWSDVLTSWGLPAEKGRPARMWLEDGIGGKRLGRRASFVGSLADLQDVEEQEFRRRKGRVSSSGHGPE